jgi:hypothetical protein
MSSTGIELPQNLADAELYQRLFVKPMIDALDSRMKGFMEDVKGHVEPVIAGQALQDRRLERLERDQKKALLGWSVYATAAAGLLAYGYSWIKNHIHLG